MTSIKEIGSENTKIGDIEYFRISPNVSDKSDAVINRYRNLLHNLQVLPFDFENFLDDFLRNNGVHESELFATQYRDETFFLHLSNGRSLTFTLDDFKRYLEQAMLKEVSLEEIESRVQAIKDAMESIYDTNHSWIYNRDLRDTQLVEDGPYKGKNMRELQAHLDIETRLLFQVYDLRGESHKKQEILKRKIELLAGVGDKYETGAAHFQLSDGEIDWYVRELIADKSYDEIFAYIRDVNKAINDNWKRSRMTNQVNGKLVSSLYIQTFEKLKDENAADEPFFELARVMTGRRDIMREQMNALGSSDLIQTEVIGDIDDMMKDIDIANYVLLYVMHRPGGVFDTLSQEIENINIEIKDPVIGERTPFEVVQDSSKVLGQLGNTGDALFEQLNFQGGSNITQETKYEDLSFDEKIALGALARIAQHIPTKIEEYTQRNTPQDPYSQLAGSENEIDIKSLLDDIMGEVEKFSTDSIDAINQNIHQQFKSKTDMVGWFRGPTAQKLGIDGTLGSIFDLYQDINGNGGLFDLKDTTKNFVTPGRGVLLISGALVSAVVIIGVVGAPTLALAAGGKAAYSSLKLVGTGAAIGFSIGVLDVVLSPSAYDSIEESALQAGGRIGLNTALGAGFFWGASKLFGPKLFTSPIFSRITGQDVLFTGGGETVIASFIVEPMIQSAIMQQFPEFYTNTDNRERVFESDQERLARLEREKLDALGQTEQGSQDLYEGMMTAP